MFDERERERENCMPTALYTVDQVFTFFISVLEDLKEPNNWHFEKGTKNVSRKMF